MNYSSGRARQSQLSNHMPGGSIPGATMGIHQLVVSRYSRLQGHFRCKADGTIQNISCLCQTSQQLGLHPRLVA